jgi:hypothetical protein
MRNEETHGNAGAFHAAPDGEPSEVARYSRRQAIGRASAYATAGAAAWVVPEILTAHPASGATLSGPVTRASTVEPASEPSTFGPAKPVTSPKTLASTGLDLKSETVTGAALIAGGWALHHWSSRLSPPTPQGPGDPS